MPYNAGIKLDGNVRNWWGHDDDIQAWNQPLQEMGADVLPYTIDIDNSTMMQMVYANSTAIIADAVAIALHYGFQGWFIDYEDEYPPDTTSNKTQHLASFLTGFSDALGKHNMSLTICVASWQVASSVTELMNMDTYANPSDYQSMIDSYFSTVKVGSDGDISKAGVGLGATGTHR